MSGSLLWGSCKGLNEKYILRGPHTTSYIFYNADAVIIPPRANVTQPTNASAARGQRLSRCCPLPLSVTSIVGSCPPINEAVLFGCVAKRAICHSTDSGKVAFRLRRTSSTADLSFGTVHHQCLGPIGTIPSVQNVLHQSHTAPKLPSSKSCM